MKESNKKLKLPKNNKSKTLKKFWKIMKKRFNKSNNSKKFKNKKTLGKLKNPYKNRKNILKT